MRSSSSRNAAASIRSAVPGACTMASMSSRSAPEQDGQADHALAADQPDLGGVAVLHVGQHGDPAGLGEVDGRRWARPARAGPARKGSSTGSSRGQSRARSSGGRAASRRLRVVGEQAGSAGGHGGLLRRGVGGSAGLSQPPAPEDAAGNVTYRSRRRRCRPETVPCRCGRPAVAAASLRQESLDGGDEPADFIGLVQDRARPCRPRSQSSG